MSVVKRSESATRRQEKEGPRRRWQKGSTFAAKGRIVVVSDAEKLRLFIIWKRDRVLAPKPREGRNVAQLKRRKKKIVGEAKKKKKRNRERTENGMKRRKKKNLREDKEIESQGRLNWQ